MFVDEHLGRRCGVPTVGAHGLSDGRRPEAQSLTWPVVDEERSTAPVVTEHPGVYRQCACAQ
jgi:hypothetical protein